VADLFGFASDPAKFDYRSGGRAEWLAKVHAIELSKVTPAKIHECKQSFLAAAGNDPLTLRKARISVNTFLRRSRSLFSRKGSKLGLFTLFLVPTQTSGEPEIKTKTLFSRHEFYDIAPARVSTFSSLELPSNRLWVLR